jgi:hypothetical protein
MDISIAISQVLGIVLAVMGLSIVVDRKNVSAALERVQDRGYLWLWGFLTLTIGAVIVVMNNMWTSGLPLLVTVLGWLTLIKGAFLVLFPGLAIALYRKFNNDSVLLWGGIIAFVLGLILLYVRFM